MDFIVLCSRSPKLEQLDNSILLLQLALQLTTLLLELVRFSFTNILYLLGIARRVVVIIVTRRTCLFQIYFSTLLAFQLPVSLSQPAILVLTFRNFLVASTTSICDGGCKAQSFLMQFSFHFFVLLRHVFRQLIALTARGAEFHCRLNEFLS